MQQVNLYLAEFRPKLDLLSAKYMGLLMLIIILGMVVSQVRLVKKNSLLAVEVAAVNEDVKLLETKLTKLKNLPKASDRNKMEESLALVQAAIHNREYAQKVIQSKNLGNDKGFSPALTAIASLSLQDVVLTEFVLRAGGRQVELRGISKKSTAIPQYLHKLQADSAFATSEFGVLQIEKSTVPGQVTFRLGVPDKEPTSKNTQLIDAQALSRLSR